MAKINEKINKSSGSVDFRHSSKVWFLDDYVKPKYGIKAKL